MGVGDQRHAPAVLHWEKSRYPLYRRMGESQGMYRINFSISLTIHRGINECNLFYRTNFIFRRSVSH